MPGIGRPYPAMTGALPSGSHLALYGATNVVDPASAEATEIDEFGGVGREP